MDYETLAHVIGDTEKSRLVAHVPARVQTRPPSQLEASPAERRPSPCSAPAADRTLPPRTGRDPPSARLSPPVQMPVSSRTPSQTHPEDCFTSSPGPQGPSHVDTQNWPSHTVTSLTAEPGRRAHWGPGPGLARVPTPGSRSPPPPRPRAFLSRPLGAGGSFSGLPWAPTDNAALSHCLLDKQAGL